MVEYTVNVENAILFAKVIGALSVEEINQHYKKLMGHEIFTKNIRVLIDCRNAEMKIDNRDIDITRPALEEATTKWDTIKEAIIVTEPYTTVIAMVFERMSKGIKNYQFRVFSTNEAAILWLNM